MGYRASLEDDSLHPGAATEGRLCHSVQKSHPGLSVSHYNRKPCPAAGRGACDSGIELSVTKFFAKIWKRCRNEFPRRPERQRIHLAFERLKEDNQFSEYQNEEWKVMSLQCTSTSLGWNKGVLLFNLASKSVTWITCLQLKPEKLKLWVKYNFPSLEWLITEAHCEWQQPNLHSWMSVSVLVAFRSTCECSRALSSNSG